MEYLTNLDSQSYHKFIYFWGVLGIVASLIIYFAKLLPISSREESQGLAILGMVDKKLGWMIMETPILIAVLYFFLMGKNPINASVVIVGAFVFHYFHRAVIFPHRLHVKGKKMPVSMVLSTMIFYTINGYLIGYYFGSLKEYPIEWLYDPRFIIGLMLFIAGFIINVKSDSTLINLRGPGETGYKVPHGGFFRFVSCPNYLGEVIEWVGFAIMTWSLPGVIYAVWVSLALFSTGLGTHRWYRQHFGEDYPQNRKAILPYVI